MDQDLFQFSMVRLQVCPKVPIPQWVKKLYAFCIRSAKTSKWSTRKFYEPNMFIIWSNVIIFDSFKLSCYTYCPWIFYGLPHEKHDLETLGSGGWSYLMRSLVRNKFLIKLVKY